MIVSELIEKLKEVPQDAEVKRPYTPRPNDFCNVTDIDEVDGVVIID